MKINLKVQQHIQIIDKNIENSMIKNNISYLTKRYQKILDKYQNIQIMVVDLFYYEYKKDYLLIKYFLKGDISLKVFLIFLPIVLLKLI